MFRTVDIPENDIERCAFREVDEGRSYRLDAPNEDALRELARSWPSQREITGAESTFPAHL